MSCPETDSRWLCELRRYIRNEERPEPECAGYYNRRHKRQHGQIVFGGLVLLITGLLMWFPEVSGRIGVAISYLLHDIPALIMLAGIFIHIYLSTVGQPGTLRSMTRGVVTRAWAWTHHPAWYGRVTGRNPREDYDAARRRQAERAREMTSLRREDNRPVTKPEPSKSPD